MSHLIAVTHTTSCFMHVDCLYTSSIRGCRETAYGSFWGGAAVRHFCLVQPGLCVITVVAMSVWCAECAVAGGCLCGEHSHLLALSRHVMQLWGTRQHLWVFATQCQPSLQVKQVAESQRQQHKARYWQCICWKCGLLFCRRLCMISTHSGICRVFAESTVISVWCLHPLAVLKGSNQCQV